MKFNDGILAALERAAQEGFAAPETVLALIAEVRRLRGEAEWVSNADGFQLRRAGQVLVVRLKANGWWALILPEAGPADVALYSQEGFPSASVAKAATLAAAQRIAGEA